MTIRLPDFPEMPEKTTPELEDFWLRLVGWWGAAQQELDSEFARVFQGTASKENYILSNVSINRTFDQTSATDTYTSARLATLLFDLQQKGLIS